MQNVNNIVNEVWVNFPEYEYVIQERRLYQREGRAITNFNATFPAPQSDLARQTIKDPYNFDFLTLREKHGQQELEAALVHFPIKNINNLHPLIESSSAPVIEKAAVTKTAAFFML